MTAAARRSALPGFVPTLGIALLWLSLIVLLPLATLAVRPWEIGIAGVWHSITEPRVLAALRLSFGSAALAAAVNVPIGLLIAWVMVRYRFPGRSLANSLIDMPLALPTAVAGIALTALFAPGGWIGALLAPLGIKVAYTPLGILIALIFVGLPFVVRTLEPVIMDLLDRRRRGCRNARGEPRANAVARRAAGTRPLPAGRVRRSIGAWCRRIRFGDFHCRQHADDQRNCPAADRHSA